MKKLKLKQIDRAGFSVVEVVFVIVVLAALGFVGSYVFNHRNDDSSPTKTASHSQAASDDADNEDSIDTQADTQTQQAADSDTAAVNNVGAGDDTSDF